MSKFKKFASKMGHLALDGLEAMVEVLEEDNKKRAAARQQQAAAAPARAPVANVAKPAQVAQAASKPAKVDVDIDLHEWVSHCNHTSGICDACVTRIKTCIQYAIDNGVPGGFNFATGRIDPDVAACNNSCTHKKINDCCATCLFSFMDRKTVEVTNLAAISSAAVGHLSNAAMGVGNVGSGIGTMRQNLHQQSLATQAQRDLILQQQMNAPLPFASAGYGGGGGTWGRQQQLAAGMVWDPPVAARLRVSPGLPLPNPTTSFWLLPESPVLSKIQSPKLPSRADIIIIGSGITSTALLRELYRRNPSLSIVLLEARGICTGATGRNGGHIKEGPYAEYPALKGKCGNDAAARIVRFRLRHLEEIMAVAREEGAECLARSEAREVLGTDVYFDEDVMTHAVEWYDLWRKEAPEQAREFTVMDAETARTKLHIPNAVGAICGPAGALWPYRLCTAILERLIKEHPTLHLESYTPASAVTFDPSTSLYTVTTPRGTLTAPTVIHTTNAWASHLLPGLRAKVIPFEGQMSAQAPPDGLPALGDKYSWVFFHKQGFDYLTQRPTTSTVNPDATASVTAGEMMYGGGWAQTGNNGMDLIGRSDDTKLNYMAAGHLSGLLPFVFGSGTADGPTRAWDGVAIKNMWTGLIGMSADTMPWVGKVPSTMTTRGQPAQQSVDVEGGAVKTGEWCSVGFSGEGMVNCWGCATALARMVLGEEVSRNVVGREKRVRAAKGEEEVKGWRDVPLEEWFPAEFAVSEKRAKEADVAEMMSMVLGM
ncbi:hypothetical protein Dda_6685 [Drechslerella dactyloides]|uniref:FAD dependent oxidoreductase domain-containing protein n=1 Tax=Drechslerella dactyloides TaxID=74499 RepID=A0AAD6NHS1_DREDA|nr:hypothetical protein Dda_6685 [Drechslerella dactyloides]